MLQIKFKEDVLLEPSNRLVKKGIYIIKALIQNDTNYELDILVNGENTSLSIDKEQKGYEFIFTDKRKDESIFDILWMIICSLIIWPKSDN